MLENNNIKLRNVVLFDSYDIWGLTAKLILRLLEVGLGHVPRFIVHHPDSPTWMQSAQDYLEKDQIFEKV